MHPNEPIIRKKVKTQQMTAKEYYEKQTKHTTAERQYSRIIDVRKFQNWIKAVMINQGSDYIRGNMRTTKTVLLNVLELGCGKGGDLGKWLNARTGLLFGFDISGSSLEEALNRYKSNHNDFYFHLKQASAEASMLMNQVPDQVHFDVVSMQFVANLLFSSEDSVDRLLENATSRLVSQGLFLLTITDANVLVRKMREKAVLTPDNTYKYENEHVSIMFDSLEFKGCPYGLKYSFYLEDSVGERNPETKQITYVPEYLIEMREFRRKAAQYDLEVVEDLNFTEVYHKYKDQYQQLMRKMMNIEESEWTMKQSLWEISHLYRYVILRHTRGTEQSKIRRKHQLVDIPRWQIELDDGRKSLSDK